MKTLFKLTLLLTIIATFTSCRKDRRDPSLEAATNEVLFQSTEKSFQNEVDALTMKSNDEGCNAQNWMPPCAEITDSGEDEYPRTITLDFGEGCTGWYGIQRSGIIHIDLTAPMDQEGAVRTVTFEGYIVNGNALSGTRITTSNGTNGNGQPLFTREVDVTITRNGNIWQRDFLYNITWLSGYDSQECGDNVFEVAGSGTVTRPGGATVSRTIIEPLIVDRVCGYTTSGVIQVNAPLGERTIDFGDGNCDNDAVIIIDGESYDVELD